MLYIPSLALLVLGKSFSYQWRTQGGGARGHLPPPQDPRKMQTK